MKRIVSAILLAASLCSTAAEMPWKGRIISLEHQQSTPNTWLIFRKDAHLDAVPKTMPARIAADSKYWLWINGEPVVFEGGLKRGPSPNGTYYDEVDIAPYLKAGDNTIAVLVWHYGRNGFSHTNSGLAGLLFDAQAPGAEILSDTSWRGAVYDAYSDTEAPFPNFRLPESNIRFDARRERKGWNQPGYDGRLARCVGVANPGQGQWGELVKRPIPQWKNSGIVPYVSTVASGDTIKCRLPYNCQATPYLKVKAPAGKTVHIQTDNYAGGGENNVRAEYITADGTQEYESLGWMNGHEVWYIVPEGVEVLDLGYRETGYGADFTGEFECDDPFLNELWKRSARTLYVTMRDNYMDCPDRERAQWWGDEVNELGETFYALSPEAWQLATKGLRELVAWQRNTGEFYSPVPSPQWGKELPLQMLASVGWYGFHTQYYYSADSTWVADVYPAVKKYLHTVWQTDQNGMPIVRGGDWNWSDWGENWDTTVLTACWYYLALKAEHDFALMLGQTADAAMIEEMMKKIEANFDSCFWTGTEYRSKAHGGLTDDRANAMAVVTGLASADKYPALANVLATQYHASPYMEKYVLEALFLMNRPQQALDRMHERYAKMMGYKDYTTLFEGWGIGAEGFGGGTINHAWSGGPLTMLSQKVCGIEPTSPGFATFTVKPQMGNLKKARATVHTAHGFIKVDLQRKGKNIRATIEVPQGCTATVPGAKNAVLTPGTHTLTIR